MIERIFSPDGPPSSSRGNFWRLSSSVRELMRFLSSPPSSWWLEKYSRRCFNNGAFNVSTYRVLGVRRRKKLFRSWLERSQSRGLRGNFKLISTWDLCLPRKQRTFVFRIFLLFFFFLSSLCFSTSPLLFFAFSSSIDAFTSSSLLLGSRKLPTYFIFDARPRYALTTSLQLSGINWALVSRREDQNSLIYRLVALASLLLPPFFISFVLVVFYVHIFFDRLQRSGHDLWDSSETTSP